MELNLKGKIVIVSGGGSGIGQSIVEAFAEEGAIPIIVDRAVAKSLGVQKRLQSLGKESMVIEANLELDIDCKKVINETIARYGKIDCLVNNAGVNDGISLDNSPEEFMQSIRRNLIHYFALTHYSLEFLKKTQGTIVNISSKTAITGQGDTSGYTASKGAQLSLTREWALCLRTFGIRVNAVVPAEVMTPQYDSWIKKFDNPEAKLKEITKRIPLGERMTSPKEIADMVVFLASERASHITGQHIFVDGGYTHLDRSISS